MTEQEDNLLCFAQGRRTKQVQQKDSQGRVIRSIAIQLFKCDKLEVWN